MNGSPPVEVTVCNAKGLHARAAAKLVRLADGFDAVVMVGKDEAEVAATSILGLMMLGAALGSTLRLKASGPQADLALSEVKNLIERGFDEQLAP